MRRFAGLPILWQTMLLLLAAVVIAQLVGFVLLFVNPPPGPQLNRMNEVVALLRNEPRDPSERERPLDLHTQPSPPAAQSGMVADPALTRAFAERAGVPASAVRLYFEPERSGEPNFRRRKPRQPFSVRHGETLFFTPIVVGLQTPAGWKVAETPPRSLIPDWQWRMLQWLLASAVALAPLAWVFARALTRPIRRFAEAAGRLGGDPQAPSVAEEGPAELRTTARALNMMRDRVAGYVGERTEMIGAIAHDLRTPLARIAFRVEAAPEPMREKVLADVEQMRAMLAATIGFVKSTTAPRTLVRVDLAALARAIAEQEVDLGHAVTQGAIDEAHVMGDPMTLERLIQNLIDNALVYGGGAELSVAREGAQVVLRVVDRGPGMPEELLGRVFQPFVRGDPSRNRTTGGIGLGLTIARTIAEDHGGTLALANRVDGGLEAVLRLAAA